MAKSHSMGLEELIEVLSDALKCKKDEVFDKISNICDSLIEHKKMREFGMREGNILEFTDLVLTRERMLVANSNDQLTVSEIVRILLVNSLIPNFLPRQNLARLFLIFFLNYAKARALLDNSSQVYSSYGGT